MDKIAVATANSSNKSKPKTAAAMRCSSGGNEIAASTTTDPTSESLLCSYPLSSGQ